jgi:hypothetical protein
VLDNATCFIYFPDSDDWDLSNSNSDQYTIECWIRFRSISSALPNVIIEQAGSVNHYGWSLETTGTSEFEFKYSLTGSAWDVVITSSGAALTTGIWYHLAVDKDATGKIRIYLNGTVMGSATPANSGIFNTDAALAIGHGQFFGFGVDGWMDEVRITKGTARYKTDAGFVMPTAAFPRTGP